MALLIPHRKRRMQYANDTQVPVTGKKSDLSDLIFCVRMVSALDFWFRETPLVGIVHLKMGVSTEVTVL